jgi:hydroxymethylpyrimidine pyrophosphatase-like HAD family hydrolase
MRYRALATDFDGTLAEHGIVPTTTLEALRRLAEAGFKLLLVSGREKEQLYDIFPHVRLFDHLVLENGALLHQPHSDQCTLIAEPPPARLLQALQERRIPYSAGRSIVATVEPHGAALQAVIEELQLNWHLIRNKNDIMALPANINKAAGLTVALQQLGLQPAEVVGVGDAENDLDFLQMCGLAVAVANALPGVKATAHWTMQGERGAGVTELIDRLLRAV